MTVASSLLQKADGQEGCKVMDQRSKDTSRGKDFDCGDKSPYSRYVIPLALGNVQKWCMTFGGSHQNLFQIYLTLQIGIMRKITFYYSVNVQ